MWTTAHSAETDLSPAAVWAALRDLHTGLFIDGPSADTIGPELGPQISADFPSAMQSLFDAASARSADVVRP